MSPSTSRSGTATVASAKITKKLECVSRKMKKKIKEEKNVHIRIATINVRTCQEDIKLAKIVQAASSLDIDILAIQEARRLGSDCKMLLSESIYGWQIAWSGHRRKREHGVATLFAPHVKVEDFKEHLAARIISTTVEVKGMKMYKDMCFFLGMVMYWLCWEESCEISSTDWITFMSTSSSPTQGN